MRRERERTSAFLREISFSISVEMRFFLSKDVKDPMLARARYLVLDPVVDPSENIRDAIGTKGERKDWKSCVLSRTLRKETSSSFPPRVTHRQGSFRLCCFRSVSRESLVHDARVVSRQRLRGSFQKVRSPKIPSLRVPDEDVQAGFFHPMGRSNPIASMRMFPKIVS